MTDSSHAYDGSNAIVELSPSLRVKQRFGDPLWRADNLVDYDLGSSNAALVNGFAFTVGRRAPPTSPASGTSAGSAGRWPASPSARKREKVALPAGGSAVDGSVVYVNCEDGEPGNADFSHITAVQVTTRRPYLHVVWRSSTVHTAGPPIVAGGKVWTVLLDGKVVVGLSQADGMPELEEPVGVNGNHFPTPSVADGLLLVPSLDRVGCVRRPLGTPSGAAPGPMSSGRAPERNRSRRPGV